MKTSIYLCLTLFFSLSAIAQTPFKRETITPKSNTTKISVDLEYASLKVVQGDFSEVTIDAYVNIGDNAHNDAFSMEISEKNGSIIVNTELDNEFLKSYNNFHTIDWDDNNGHDNTDGREVGEDDRQVIINGKAYFYEKNNNKYYKGLKMQLYLEIKVPKDLELDVETLYGRNSIDGISANTKIDAVYGSVEASLSPNYKSKQLDFNSTYGTVDVAIPENLQADVKLTTGYGKIYTDLDIQPDIKKKGDNCMFGDDISAKMNGGGVPLKLNSGYANIYLRKS